MCVGLCEVDTGNTNAIICAVSTMPHGCLNGKPAVVREVTSESSAVLHYTFTRFSDLKARRDRCDCAPTEEDAKRCFILPFDRMVRQQTHTLRLPLCSTCRWTLC